VRPRDVKLLNEFLTRLAAATNDQQDGMFVPKGVVHLLGPQTYEQILKDNNFFLTTVATVPINLEYRAWFAMINETPESDTDPLSLYDHLLRKTWFLQIEEVDHRKCLLITTKHNLPEAREWVDTHLEPLICQSIPAGIDPSPSQLPRRLDQPMHSASSQSYADVLKKPFSLAPNAMTANNDNNRPPRKRQAASIIDYDSDTSTAATSTITTATTSNPSQCYSHLTKDTTPPHDYANELQSIKMEIQALKTMISNAVTLFKSTIASVTEQRSKSSDTDTNADAPLAPHNNNLMSHDLGAIIQDLKYEIATIITETRAMFEQQLLLATHNKCPPSAVT